MSIKNATLGHHPVGTHLKILFIMTLSIIPVYIPVPGLYISSKFIFCTVC